MVRQFLGAFLVIGLILLFQTSCDKKKDDASSDNGYTGVASIALTNIDSVQNGMSPDSMLTTQATATSLSPMMASDFCGANFFSCQPKIVKLYLAISKAHVAIMKAFLAGISQGLVDIKDGDANQNGVEIDAYIKLLYNKTSATDFSILAKSIASGESYFYFKSVGTTYQLEIDFAKIPAEKKSPSDPAVGKVSVSLKFTDSTHWIIEVFASEFACKTDDPKGPEKIKISTKRNGEIWNGKAMLYNSRSMEDNATCATAGSDERSSATYTEFAGNHQVSKANVYLMKRTVTGSTSADYSNYTLNNLCATYASNWASSGGQIMCENFLQNQFGEPVSTYSNPFCNLRTTNIPSWSNTCSSYSTEVSAASFDDNEVVWVAPNVLSGTLTINLPTTAL
jgi:hypothetical protein